MYFCFIESPVGRLLLTATNTHLTGLYYPPKHDRCSGLEECPEQRVLQITRQQLRQYFCGERKSFDVPLAPEGTPFQQQVWTALQTIPYGFTTNYGEIADQIHNTLAVRAVGAANGANPISILIPCHRVIGRNGKLTGYAGGIEQKQLLLNLEAEQEMFGGF